MQKPVQIKKTEKSILVSFSYNSDLVDIMRDQKGIWNRKNKIWIFPLSRISQIREVLISKKYKVNIISETEEEKRFNQYKKKSRNDFSNNKNIVSI